MSHKYETFGPFNVARDKGKVADGAFSEFWIEREKDSPIGLCDAVGVYLFVVQAKKNSPAKPWYVGRTDKQSFKKRFNQQHLHFRQVLEKATNGKLQIYLLALKSPGGKAFRKPTKVKITPNDWLESMLIGACISCNSQLINASKVKYLRTLAVPGYLNNKKGKLTKSAASLKKTLQVS